MQKSKKDSLLGIILIGQENYSNELFLTKVNNLKEAFSKYFELMSKKKIYQKKRNQTSSKKKILYLNIKHLAERGPYKPKEIAKILHITRQRARSIMKYLEKNAIFSENRGGKKKINPEQENFLRNYFSKQENLGKHIKDAYKDLLKNFPLIKSISISSLYKRLRKMRFIYKKTREIKQSGNTFNNKILRKEFCAFLLEFMNKHYIIIFLDKCSLQYHPSYA